MIDAHLIQVGLGFLFATARERGSHLHVAALRHLTQTSLQWQGVNGRRHGVESHKCARADASSFLRYRGGAIPLSSHKALLTDS